MDLNQGIPFEETASNFFDETINSSDEEQCCQSTLLDEPAWSFDEEDQVAVSSETLNTNDSPATPPLKRAKKTKKFIKDPGNRAKKRRQAHGKDNQFLCFPSWKMPSRAQVDVQWPLLSRTIGILH